MKFLPWMTILALALPASVGAQGLLERLQQLTGTGAPVQVAEPGLVRVGQLQAGLISETTSVIVGKPLALGLRLVHDPEWHTYWRNPGDSGLATKIDWQLPEGWLAGPMQWPKPSRFPVGPLANFGYEGDVVLPVVLTPPKGLGAGQTVEIKGKASWLICRDVCIPGETMLSIKLPVSDAAATTVLSVDAPRIAQARASLPTRESQREPQAFISGKTLSLWWRSVGKNETPGIFLPYVEALITPAAAQPLSKTKQGWRLDIPLGESSSMAVKTVRASGWLEGIWVVPGESALEWRAKVRTGPAPSAVELVSPGQTAAEQVPKKSSGAAEGLNASEGSASSPVSLPRKDDSGGSWFGVTDHRALLLALAGAFIGGLILNLMPCVFPVISLKVLSFAGSAHSKSGPMRDALIFSLGVIASFLVLAALLIALKSAGEAVGWGFQLQEPWVVLLLALLFVLIAANLFGVFEMGMMGSRVANAGFVSRVSQEPGALGSFTSGVLAVIVASPCTAPFMGSAIGFTATASLAETLAVFTALGVGMSAPYVGLAAWPGLLQKLPRPGPWMVGFKQLMGFPMLLAAAWLIWVLSSIQGVDAVLYALVAAITLAWVLWIYGWALQQRRLGFGGLTGLILALAVLIFASVRATTDSPTSAVVSPVSALQPADEVKGALTQEIEPGRGAGPLIWTPWTPGLAERLQAEGQTVFVDFTASWCITCQANKIRVLNSETIAAAFQSAGVRALRADWTKRDPAIAKEIERHGKSGIPLYLVYRPGQTSPMILSEWLSEDEVLRAIR
jgi:thiol:disulfide interchange protein/DsbC/DsbD-like thiol-disulfide interchange protein